MYWPVSTPRIYATTTSESAQAHLYICNDGDALSRSVCSADPRLGSDRTGAGKRPERPASASSLLDAMPVTPARPVERDDDEGEGGSENEKAAGRSQARVPVKEAIQALCVARSGHIFVAITTTSMTIWQTKPMVVLAVAVRSDASVASYGSNIGLLLRPDSAMLVVQTRLGYLITYSLATEAETVVYKPHFPSHTNLQRRRQSHGCGTGQAAPDHIMGARDISLRFQTVIKVEAGIESVLALDDELVVATRKPAAVQCMRWTRDGVGSRTSTELLGRMSWLGKQVTVTVTAMTHDRPMNLLTWVTSDGCACAVQRIGRAGAEANEPQDRQRLFQGHCFHVPASASDHATRCVINARFSLVAVGCADGSIRVFVARDYEGNIAASHEHRPAVSRTVSGGLTTVSYSPDGYCLFAGYDNGWATWSVYGKPLGSSFHTDAKKASASGAEWMVGVREAAWIGGGSELLLVAPEHEAIWRLEMARSAATTGLNAANLFRTLLLATSSIMVYRGDGLPDLTSISAEPTLWHTASIPASYLVRQWPVKCAVISADGRYVAVAGRRGLAHYSVHSGRWKTFASEAGEDEFQVRGGMCWYQNMVVAATESGGVHALRLYAREASLDPASVLHVQHMAAPVVVVTPSGQDSLLVYTHENLLYHFVFAPAGPSSKLIQVGQMAFDGIVRSPARVRGLSWILAENQLLDGDPSNLLFLVDGKLVLLQPVLDHDGRAKYEMRVISHHAEFYLVMRDQPFPVRHQLAAGHGGLRDSLWIFDGAKLKAWPDMARVLTESQTELAPPVSIAVDFYPLSILPAKAVVLGLESDLVQRRHVGFSVFRLAIRTHLFLPELLRHLLVANRAGKALDLARQYSSLAYFGHALELLLHEVLDDEVDANPPPPPELAVLPRVLSLLSSFQHYLDIVVQCARKTEVRSWRTLFAYLPPPQELFEESLQRGSLKTAGGYLLVLHTFDELAAVSAGQPVGGGIGSGSVCSEQSVRLLSRAMRDSDWDLCKELARFLAALDETGDTLREALEAVGARAPHNAASSTSPANDDAAHGI